eukprot:3481482-Alexandrium_andersonii.AAC.1
MSASLVGSEMCIRDSLPPNSVDRAPINRNRFHPQSLKHARPVPSASNRCLLYTSDAADDM